MSDNDYIDYGLLIDEAMHIIVRKVLERINKTGLPGDHHFYITFLTNYPGVMISETLQEKYPHEMTIVLQHQWWDLEIEEDRFSVVLSFDNVKENLTVPFDALTSFADPSVKFGLQFRHAATVFETEDDDEVIEALPPSEERPKAKAKSKTRSEKKESNVVSLDKFRKKKK